jgi:D-alanyl-lipoteichoic acid acyltransferase DltB (MBOAT superfamily)
VADRLAPLVDQVYADPTSYYGITLFAATAFFAFQVYCDFSGYSEIAIGAAHIMGITLMKNFNCPFFAVNMQDLWSRWHISLTSWFKDYVYIALGGNRVKAARRYFNLIFTFTLSGLWHGANWGYVAWGAQQGVYLALGSATKTRRERINARFGRLQKTLVWRLWHMAVVFLLFCSGLVFFRSAELGTALTVFRQSFQLWTPATLAADFAVGRIELLVAGLLLAGLLVTEWKMGSRYFYQYLHTKSPAFKGVFLFVLLLVVLNLGVFNATDFIYFQF